MSATLARSGRPFDRDVLAAADRWGAGRCGVALLDRDGLVAERGSRDVALAWASVTKVASALTVLRLAELGRISLDEPAGPPGATVRHLLAHASGLSFEEPVVVSPPERTRIYSNAGFDALAAHVEARAGTSFGRLVRELVLGPLGMSGAALAGPASQGMHGTLRD
ncbi:MAG TPA: serine hydrolase domain-containing protein, partial [Candidatus Limnocylindrales bacterium]|nr:serine hydrolase domain-containing protein [Candidatus Limnocylindrales bacterium]